jgi:hypothetical protein
MLSIGIDLSHFQEVIQKLQDDGIIKNNVDSELAAFGITALIEVLSAHFTIDPKVQDEASIRRVVSLHIHAVVGSNSVDC